MGIEQGNDAAEKSAEAAKSKMGEMMPVKMSDAEIGMEVGPMPDKELKEITDGYPEEVDASKYKSLVNQAHKNLPKLTQGSSYGPMAGPDGKDYLYVHDPSQNPPDRLFRAEASEEGGVDVSGEFNGDYEEVKKPKGRDKEAKKYAKGQIGGDDLFTVEDGDTTYVLTKEGKFYKGA